MARSKILLFVLVVVFCATFTSNLNAMAEGRAECRFSYSDLTSLGPSDFQEHRVTYISGRELDILFGNWEFLEYEDVLYVMIWLDRDIMLVKSDIKYTAEVQLDSTLLKPISGLSYDFRTGKPTGYIWEIVPVSSNKKPE